MSVFGTTTFKKALYAFALSGVAAGASAQGKVISEPIPPPRPPFPPPIFRPADLRADEKPVEVASTNEVV